MAVSAFQDIAQCQHKATENCKSHGMRWLCEWPPMSWGKGFLISSRTRYYILNDGLKLQAMEDGRLLKLYLPEQSFLRYSSFKGCILCYGLTGLSKWRDLIYISCILFLFSSLMQAYDLSSSSTVGYALSKPFRLWELTGISESLSNNTFYYEKIQSIMLICSQPKAVTHHIL